MASLIIRYEPDPEDEVGKLWFNFRADRFSGSAFFWSNLFEFAEIISKLQCYPLGDPVKWTWGYEESEGSNLVLGLSVMQVDHAGKLRATIEIADLYDTSRRLTTKFETEYNALDILCGGLKLIVSQRAGEALLSGR